MTRGNTYDALEAYLLDHSLVTEASIARAKRGIADVGGSLGVALNRLGLLSEADLVGASKDVLSVEEADCAAFPTEKLELPNVEDSFLLASRALPVDVGESRVQVAVADPFDDFVRQALEYASGKNVEYVVCAPSEIDSVLDKLYRPKTPMEAIDTYDADSELTDVNRLKDLASEAPVVRYVNQLLHKAVTRNSSDVHIEPMENRLHVRLRLDGMLEEVESPPEQLKSAITSRIKIMAGLDIAERRLPQDGRIRLAVQGRDIDFRVSTTPTAFGESVVLRILDRDALKLDLQKLGFPTKVLREFREALSHAHGIILVTGPTGSGKTTTLYAALSILNSNTRKILTIEDPIEYMIDGINQVQVNSKIGLRFASALRSFLRQDPDIMMVGEIRDPETAQVAIQAALTGHLILSTLHTNSAADAVARLLDMGMEDFLLASTLRVVIAQRLVRRLCTDCKSPVEDSATGGANTVYCAEGCTSCLHTGYRGRTMVVELLRMSEAIQRLMQENAPANAIEKVAVREGMTTMFDQGMQLVARGITSREEIFRVVGKPEDR